MKQAFLYCVVLLLFTGCKKEQGPKVDIYLLHSFTTVVDQSTIPATVSIQNPVLESRPLVADKDIELYAKATSTFILHKDIQSIIQDFNSDKAFAVTVDNEPVYYGKFHPLHLSSILFGVATITPMADRNDALHIGFATFDGSTFLQQLDKRNDSRIMQALDETGRLR